MISQYHKNSNMNTQLYIRRAIAGSLALSLMVPSLAAAETSVNADINAQSNVPVTNSQTTTGGGASVTISAAAMTRAKAKGDQEIDRRIKALNSLSTRINGITKLNADIKSSITTNVQNQINLLTTLKAKIDADTDGATLKADVQSITQAYRVYALVMPQSHIAAAADREAKILNMMAELGGKLQARIQAAGQAGADVTALTAALTDLGTLLGSAQTHAQAAIVGTATLTPDGGDKTKMAANETALKTARTEIQAAQKDLVNARKDIETIIKGLKTIKVNTTASSSVQTP
jgi:hypothetical protein